MTIKRFRISLAVLAVLTVVVFISAISIGRLNAEQPFDAIKSLFQAMGVDAGVSTVVFNYIVLLRLPRVLTTLLVGAGLAVAGVGMQAVFKNPLAAPDTLGVSAGAGFGAALSIILGLSSVFTQLFAFGFAALAVGLSLLLAKGKSKSITNVILTGIVIAAVFSAGLSLIQVLASPTDQLPRIVFWLMGSFSNSGYGTLIYLAPIVLLSMTVIIVLRWRINVLMFSDNEATTLGVKVRVLRVIIIICSTLITATCVSAVGIIGWVGLVIPHISRMIFGSNNRYVVPTSIFMGAIFITVIDTLSRVITPYELPISIITALVGAPIFLILLRIKRKYSINAESD